MKQGTKIQITSGSLTGLTGEIVRSSDKYPGGFSVIVKTKIGKEVKILFKDQIKTI